MFTKRIATLAVGASLAASAILAPQAVANDHRGGGHNDRDDKSSVVRVSSFDKDKKRGHDYRGDRHDNKKNNDGSSFKAFSASSKDKDRRDGGHHNGPRR
ncbi:hypothetical protein [Corynebacterium comes]|uniref:Secreted protein n=1 Tax=Corynebacterium comes TaxID=2675218 RepID=A0A6B8VJS5_9CORY|nr:hypothetical protein [Corynebacterium comes]QGU03309.1 hypothetical protein CETAM_00065 [Corynebacterium comes]